MNVIELWFDALVELKRTEVACIFLLGVMAGFMFSLWLHNDEQVCMYKEDKGPPDYNFRK